MAYVPPRQKSAMSDASENMSEMVACPYDAVHMVSRRKMPAHLDKCSQNYPENPLVECSFNSTHKVPRSMIRDHMENCLDKDKVQARETMSGHHDTVHIMGQREFDMPEENSDFSGADWGEPEPVVPAPARPPVDAPRPTPTYTTSSNVWSGARAVVDGVGAPIRQQHGSAAENFSSASAEQNRSYQLSSGRGRAGRGRAPHLSKPEQRRPGGMSAPVATPSLATPSTHSESATQQQQQHQQSVAPPPGFAARAQPADHWKGGPIPPQEQFEEQPHVEEEMEDTPEKREAIRREHLAKLAKQRRNKLKNLNQISALEAKVRAGNALDEDQLAKISRKEHFLREMRDIEMAEQRLLECDD